MSPRLQSALAALMAASFTFLLMSATGGGPRGFTITATENQRHFQSEAPTQEAPTSVRSVTVDTTPVVDITAKNKNMRLPNPVAEKSCPLPQRVSVEASETFDSFIPRILGSLNATVVRSRPLKWVAREMGRLIKERGVPADGFWAEFGVNNGYSLDYAYRQLANSSVFKGVIAGFDSFQGLPVAWRGFFKAGFFGHKNQYDAVRALFPPSVEIYKGWFQNTIGAFRDKHPSTPAALIHHDGDLFVSTAITLSMLSPRIVPGTLMCFDELMGYPGYEQHEILALYLWMVDTGAVLCPIAVNQPVTHRFISPVKDVQPPWKQSTCFQVIAFN